jgi:hypothetical protein
MKTYPVDFSCRGYDKEQIILKAEILSYALDALIEATYDARSIYELFGIKRVGDILKYLWLKPIELPKNIEESYQSKRQNALKGRNNHPWPDDQIPFLIFDSRFFYNWDSEPIEDAWLSERHGDEFRAFIQSCYEQIKEAQNTLRSSEDLLIKNAIRLIDAGKHKYDFEPVIKCFQVRNDLALPNLHRFSESYYKNLTELLQMPAINSVAYRDGNDYQTIRLCCNEQLRRVHQHGQSLDDFKICAIGDEPVDAEAWGAKLLWYSEGLGLGDLFIQQERDYGTPLKKLVEESWTHSPFLFCIKDEGKIAGYQREIGDDWVLYRRNEH